MVTLAPKDIVVARSDSFPIPGPYIINATWTRLDRDEREPIALVYNYRGQSATFLVRELRKLSPEETKRGYRYRLRLPKDWPKVGDSVRLNTAWSTLRDRIGTVKQVVVRQQNYNETYFQVEFPPNNGLTPCGLYELDIIAKPNEPTSIPFPGFRVKRKIQL